LPDSYPRVIAPRLFGIVTTCAGSAAGPENAVMRSLGRSLSPPALAAALGLICSAVPAAAQEVQKPPAAAPPAVDPEAVQALKEMSAYLATLPTFEVRAETTRDLVSMNGHRVQLGGVSDYKVRRPSGFVIDVTTDYKQRRFYYDGKQFTVYAPQLGFYATAAAPPTNLETINAIESRYGVDLPLDDLFRWNDPASGQVSSLSSAFYVGPATVDGVATDHYVFRENDKNIDWEIWIQQGDQPLPRKLVIVDRSDEARPAYTARLTWNLNPRFPADAFTFRPGPDAKQIHLATLDQ
jgi:hypothetical protein